MKLYERIPALAPSLRSLVGLLVCWMALLLLAGHGPAESRALYASDQVLGPQLSFLLHGLLLVSGLMLMFGFALPYVVATMVPWLLSFIGSVLYLALPITRPGQTLLLTEQGWLVVVTGWAAVATIGLAIAPTNSPSGSHTAARPTHAPMDTESPPARGLPPGQPADRARVAPVTEETPPHPHPAAATATNEAHPLHTSPIMAHDANEATGSEDAEERVATESTEEVDDRWVRLAHDDQDQETSWEDPFWPDASRRSV